MKKYIGVALLFGVVLVAGVSVKPKSATVRADEAKPSHWTKSELGLTIYKHVTPTYGRASASGYWKSTSELKDKQLAGPVVVSIECYREERRCTEAAATVMRGVLQADLTEYDITSWNIGGIVAEDNDGGICGIGHRLSLDFQRNAVIVTNYPKQIRAGEHKIQGKDMCSIFEDASSYKLQGGLLMMSPAATWDALEK
jgi:hypothetical protein